MTHVFRIVLAVLALLVFTSLAELHGVHAQSAPAPDAVAATTITDITRTGEAVLLRYSFDYEGNQIPTAITLTPAGESLDVVFDFADGAYLMSGTATRKKA
jgi:hypothetical protein